MPAEPPAGSWVWGLPRGLLSEEGGCQSGGPARSHRREPSPGDPVRKAADWGGRPVDCPHLRDACHVLLSESLRPGIGHSPVPGGLRGLFITRSLRIRSPRCWRYGLRKHVGWCNRFTLQMGKLRPGAGE